MFLQKLWSYSQQFSPASLVWVIGKKFLATLLTRLPQNVSSFHLFSTQEGFEVSTGCFRKRDYIYLYIYISIYIYICIYIYIAWCTLVYGEMFVYPNFAPIHDFGEVPGHGLAFAFGQLLSSRIPEWLPVDDLQPRECLGEPMPFSSANFYGAAIHPCQASCTFRFESLKCLACFRQPKQERPTSSLAC